MTDSPLRTSLNVTWFILSYSASSSEDQRGGAGGGRGRAGGRGGGGGWKGEKRSERGRRGEMGRRRKLIMLFSPPPFPLPLFFFMASGSKGGQVHTRPMSLA